MAPTDIQAKQMRLQVQAKNRLARFIPNIKAQQERLGISNKELAKAMGVSSGRITQLYMGETGMSLLNMERLADALSLELRISFDPYPDMSHDDRADALIEREEYRREQAELHGGQMDGDE